MDYTGLKIPNHIGIIVDGNGRWAKSKGKTRSMGHKAGFDNLSEIAEYLFDKGIKCVSAYCFSTENFKRSEQEVNYLFELFVRFFRKQLDKLKKKNIKVVISGRREPFPKRVLKAIDEINEEMKNVKSDKVFNLCMNYGGRPEIADGIKKLVKDIKDGKITEEDINENMFSKYMYNELPDVDFIIRTGGEHRLSNFLLWQGSYAEFYFPKTYFPAFDTNEMDKAIIEYTKRDRRFGNIDYSKYK